MKVSELQEHGFTALTLPDGDREIVGAYMGDLLSWVMGRARADAAWITIMSNQNVAAVAVLADVSCVILTEGVTLDENVKELAEAKGINVMTTALPSYEAAVKLSELI